MNDEASQLQALMDLKAEMTAELHPDLKPYLLTGPVGQMIKHPLINEILVIPGMHGHSNRLYEKRKALLVEYRESRSWARYVFTHERPWRADALAELIIDGHITLATAREWQLAKDVWIDSENVDESDTFWAGVWAQADLALTLDKRERKAFDALPDPIPVWHGLEREDEDELGFSWTTSEHVGNWFARRFGTLKDRQSYLAKGVVPKAKVKAYLLGRGEYEIIAFPADVEQVRIRVTRAPQGDRPG